MSRSEAGPPRDDGAADIAALLGLATRHDGVAPLSERFRMLLGAPTAGLTVASRKAGGEVAAYGARLPDGTIELVVAPRWRRRGLGTSVFRELWQPDQPGQSVWAHGDLPAARAFAASRRLVRIRSLHKMARSLGAQGAAPVVFPDGFRLAAFAPGDEEAWLAVNNAAFANHPEQGRVDRAALAGLMSQPWFDPGDLLLLWGPDGELAGSHWTKIDPAERVDSKPAGEVYVLAVAPDWHGHGLAGPLTVAGLRHLSERGMEAVVLYVDEDNSRAMATYSRLGFVSVAVDAQYAAR